LINGIGPKHFRKLIDIFGTASAIWNANEHEIITNFGENLGTKFIRQRHTIDIENELKLLQQREIKLLLYGTADYPQILSQIADPPICLYYQGKGSLNILENAVTIVGTRLNTKYGEENTRKIVEALVVKGITVVSGLAFGIDRLAHQFTLENNGKTVAILGSAVDDPTPRSHFSLYEKILDQGLVLSETNVHEDVQKGSFPRRNRILAAITPATVVIEAPQKSGALITANLAFDYNRDVYAIPGAVNMRQSLGCNNLIRMQKAKLIDNIEELLEDLGYSSARNFQNFDKTQLNQDQIIILDQLKLKALSLDELKYKFDIDTSKLLASLITLEVQGLVTRDEKGLYNMNI